MTYAEWIAASPDYAGHPLEPCPFCSNPAEYKTTLGSWGGRADRMAAGCKQCGIYTPEESYEHEYYGPDAIRDTSIRALGVVSRKWNRRTAQGAPPA